jgi:hypothetical protein
MTCFSFRTARGPFTEAPRLPRPVLTTSARRVPHIEEHMGDKNPKSKDKAKKQDTAKNKQQKDAHDKKQAPPAAKK